MHEMIFNNINNNNNNMDMKWFLKFDWFSAAQSIKNKNTVVQFFVITGQLFALIGLFTYRFPTLLSTEETTMVQIQHQFLQRR